MYSQCSKERSNVPQKHDREDYDKIWKPKKKTEKNSEQQKKKPKKTKKTKKTRFGVDGVLGLLPRPVSDGESAIDEADDRELVGFAGQVFVGVVRGEAGRAGLETSDPEVEVPQRQLRVEVTRVLKGQVAFRDVTRALAVQTGVVVVNQPFPGEGSQEVPDPDPDDAEDPEDSEGAEAEPGGDGGAGDEGVALAHSGGPGDDVLQVGRAYVFVTNRDEQKGWLTVVSPEYGTVLVPEDPVGRAGMIERFVRAIAEQIAPGQGGDASRPPEQPPAGGAEPQPPSDSPPSGGEPPPPAEPPAGGGEPNPSAGDAGGAQ